MSNANLILNTMFNPSSGKFTLKKSLESYSKKGNPLFFLSFFGETVCIEKIYSD